MDFSTILVRFVKYRQASAVLAVHKRILLCKNPFRIVDMSIEAANIS